MKETIPKEKPQDLRKENRLPEDLRALSHRIRRSEKAYERMNGKRHG